MRSYIQSVITLQPPLALACAVNNTKIKTTQKHIETDFIELFLLVNFNSQTNKNIARKKAWKIEQIRLPLCVEAMTNFL